MITIQRDSNNNEYDPNDERRKWDYLVFTQFWPNTQCKIWKGKRSGNSCRLPSNRDLWTVHGIWANKYGGYYPQFCNDSYRFNSSEVASMSGELANNWVNIQYPKSNEFFWGYEWNKHGTCSMDHPQLNTQKKYFQKALEWSNQYNMNHILSRAGVHPNSHMGVRLSQIWRGVKDQLGVNPTIQCNHDYHSGQHYLHEIRLCFDRNLNLMDCEGPSDQPLGNCPRNKPILYPGSSTSL